MLIEVVIPLIIVGFLIPIIVIFVIRRVRANKKKLQKGEIIDRDGHYRMEIEDDGKEIPIPRPYFKAVSSINNDS